jgi:hypothetical protein
MGAAARNSDMGQQQQQQQQVQMQMQMQMHADAESKSSRSAAGDGSSRIGADPGGGAKSHRAHRRRGAEQKQQRGDSTARGSVASERGGM